MYSFCIFIGENNFTYLLTYLDIPQAKKFHWTFLFIDDLYALTDGGQFQKSHATKCTPSNWY